LASILGLSTAAVPAGQIELVDVTAWVAAASQELLAAMGARRNAAGAWVAPHPDTVVVGERAIGPKSNEVPAYQPLLRTVAETTDLTGWVLTQDAGHTDRPTAGFIVEELHAHYAMITVMPISA